MSRLAEMSHSNFLRFKRQYGIAVDKKVPPSSYITMSKISRILKSMTPDQFVEYKMRFGFGQKTTLDSLVSRLLTRVDRLESGVAAYVLNQYDNGGLTKVMDLLHMNIRSLTVLANTSGFNEPKEHESQITDRNLAAY